MKKIILFGVLFFAVVCLYGQNSNDSIQMKKKFGGYVYQQDGKSLTTRKLSNIIKTNPDAYKEMKKAKISHTVFVIFSGVYLVSNSYVLGTTDGINYKFHIISTLAYVGLSIPFGISSDRHTKKAVTIYNNGLKYAKTTAVDYKIMLTNNGIGLKIVF